MKTIVILMDSLNRHYLNAYTDTFVQTPNIDRLAARGVCFDNHYSASLPCMPARRDMMNGRYNFLETPWGPLEPYDDCLPALLRGRRAPGARAVGEPGTYTHLITDHYHYWEWWGQGYHNFFDTWEFLRGQEGDNEIPRVREPEVPECRGKGKMRRQDWINRSLMDSERDEDYPTVRCFQRAVDFLDHNHDADDWFLHLEVFDPHEPFMCPKTYRDLYNDTWDSRYHYDWPDYAALDPELDDPAAVEHIRKSYAGTLTMADAWLGKLLDAMDTYDMWKDTAVILTTDHGHLLGEHGYWAKNYMFDYNELTHIPFLVAAPGAPAGARRAALTSQIDLMPTVLDLYGRTPSAHVQGKSLAPLLAADGAHHDSVLYGYFAKDVNWTDGRYTYCRQPRAGSVTQHHTAMATHGIFDRWNKAETGRFLERVPYPVYRTPIPSLHHHDAPDFNPIHDLEADPHQERPIHDAALEAELAGKLKATLERYDAPPCQYERLGL